MTVPPSGDYSPAHVPTVFMEMAPPPPPPPPKAEEKGGVFISRGFLAVLSVLLLGALVATAFFLNSSLETANKRIATDLGDGKDSYPSKLKDATAALGAANAQIAVLKARLDPYSTIEAAYKQVADKTVDIKKILELPDRKGFGDETVTVDGRPVDPNWRANKLLRSRLNSVAWTQTTVAALQDQLAKLEELNTAVTKFSAVPPKAVPIPTLPGGAPAQPTVPSLPPAPH